MRLMIPKCACFGASGLASPSSVLTVFVRASAKSHVSARPQRNDVCSIDVLHLIYGSEKIHAQQYITITWDKGMPTHYLHTEVQASLALLSLKFFLPGVFATGLGSTLLSNSCSHMKVRCLPICAKCARRNDEMMDTDTIGHCLSELSAMRKFRG